MASTATPLSTADFEVLNLPPGKRYELIHGEVIEQPMAYQPHEEVKRSIHRLLDGFDPREITGFAYTESMCQLSSNDLRIPDVSFYLKEDWRPSSQKSYLPPPTLAVEIVSSESASDSLSKVKDYLRAGTRSVWVVYPTERNVLAYEATNEVHFLNPADTITLPWLPGFSAKVAAFFDRL